MSNINRDFSNIKSDLKDYVKSYYPSLSNGFTEGSPGMLFLDMVSYVGDSLNYYLDKNINELFLDNMEDINSAIFIAQNYGYIPKCVYPSSTMIDVYCAIPLMMNEDGTESPDSKYIPRISQGMSCKSSNGLVFYIDDEIIFDETSEITFDAEYGVYIYKKSNVLCYNANIIERTISTPTNAEEYWNFILPENNIIKILNVVDSDNNIWHNVPFLAQDVYIGESTKQGQTQMTLQWVRTNGYKFVTKIVEDFKVSLQFGEGFRNYPVLSGPEDLKIYSKISGNSYGRVPYNTTLKVRYLVSQGELGNVGENTINSIDEISISPAFGISNILPAVWDNIKKSIIVNNPYAAIGGSGPDSINELKNRTKLMMFSQMRLASKDDFLSRIYDFPSKYGKIFKATVSMNNNSHSNNIEIYIITKNSSNHLTNCNDITKTNLKTYLNNYALITNTIDIKDMYVLNIGIDFDIRIINGYNPFMVLKDCIGVLSNKLDISNVEPEQPIYKSELINLLESINGVGNVISIKINSISDKNGSTYSKYAISIEDMSSMNNNGIIYPSANSIFEIKNNSDIRGRVI